MSAADLSVGARGQPELIISARPFTWTGFYAGGGNVSIPRSSSLLSGDFDGVADRGRAASEAAIANYGIGCVELLRVRIKAGIS